MTIEYRYDPKSAFLPAAAGLGIVLAASAGAFVHEGVEQVLIGAVAVLGAIGLLGVAPLIADRRVQLSITAKGLIYRPFSPNPIPWDDVTAIAVVHTTTELQPLMRTFWKRALHRVSVNFDVLDPARMTHGLPLYRLSARLRNAVSVPPYPIELTFLRDADAAQLVHEIKRYWKGPLQTFETTQRG